MFEYLSRPTTIRRSLRSILAVSAIVVGFASAASQAQAELVLTSTQGGGPLLGVKYVNFDEVALGVGGTSAKVRNQSQVEVGTIGLTLKPDAEVVINSLSGKYAAPFLSNDSRSISVER